MDPLGKIRRMDVVECGTQAAKHFAFADGYVNLNHGISKCSCVLRKSDTYSIIGSYGAYPIEIRDVFRHFQDRTEARPDAFVRYEYRTHLLDESRRSLADYLSVSVENVVLVANATTAFDTVFKNLAFQHGDVIVCFDNMYGSFENTVRFVSETTPAEIDKIYYNLPISDNDLCELFESTLQNLKAKGKIPRIAVFDTVNSLPAVRMPFERLTQICKLHRVLSCIDGAHGVGQFPLDLEALDADFFTSNLHKWLHVPRPCGVLYVPARNQHMLRATVPTGFSFLPLGAESSPKAFAANFASVGTLDDNPYLCIPAALTWREKLTWKGLSGEEAIMGYTRDLARRGGQLVAEILQTEILDNEEQTLSDCSLVNVRLPLTAAAGEATSGQDISQPDETTVRIMKAMIVDHETAVCIFFYGRAWWARLTAQVYLTLSDFERAGHLLKQVCNEVNNSPGIAG